MAKMFNKFNNISQCYKPNNICIKKQHAGIKDIVVGTTPEHIFSLPFDMTKDVKELIVTYKQGINIIIEKTKDQINVFDKDPHKIYFQLTEDETRKFKPIENTPIKIQIKALLANNDIVASDIYLIKCLPSLSDTTLLSNHEIYGEIEFVEANGNFYIIPGIEWVEVDSTIDW